MLRWISLVPPAIVMRTSIMYSTGTRPPSGAEESRTAPQSPSIFSAVRVTDNVAERDADVLEEDLVEAVLVGHVEQRAHRDAGRAKVEQQVGDAAMLGRVRVGAHEDVAPVGAVGEARPDLLPVDDEV